MGEIITYSKNNMQRTAKEIAKMMDNGNATFTNAVQRGLVWDNDRKSLLIHSMILKAPIPPMYSTHHDGSKVYDFLDGKQRCNTIHDFLRNQFELTNVPPVLYDDDTEMDINGCLFDDLPEEMQDNIATYSLTIYYMENLTDEEEEEIFFRINNGKSLSQIEISRVKCPAINEVQQIAKYPLFDFMTDKQRAKYTDEDIVVKMLAMLMMDEPCLDTKAIRPFMETLEITKEVKSRIYDCCKAIKEMHDDLEADDLPKVAKRLYVKTHMISLVPFVEKHGVQTEFVNKFFGSGRMTMSKKYNDHATNGSGHVQNVAARVEALEEEFKKFVQH